MKSTSFTDKVKREGKGFFDAVAKTNETVYLVMLTVYVALYIVIMTAWYNSAKEVVSNIRYGMLSIVMWGATLYLLFVIIEWRKLWKETIWLILLAIILLGATFWFSRKMSTNSYGVVMDVFFCIMAYGKSYKKMLKCIMWAALAMLVIAAIGFFSGITYERPKLSGDPGHSLGIIYPNNWGYLVFLVLMTCWYNYLRGKHVLTFVLFWAVSLFMYFYVLCRTIALLTIIFPVFALVVDLIEKRPRKSRKGIGVLGWFWTITPFLALAFVLFVSMKYEWVDANIPDNALIGTVRYRFIHNGLYLKTYGVPFAGNSYNSNLHNFMKVNNEFIEPGILDSSYVSYLIMRGGLWTGYTLLWLCVANYKAYKNRDYATNYLSAILLVFAMIERVGLEMWYCFVLLYPLAVVGVGGKKPEMVEAVSAPGEGVVLEPATIPEQVPISKPVALSDQPEVVSDVMTEPTPKEESEDKPSNNDLEGLSSDGQENITNPDVKE